MIIKHYLILLCSLCLASTQAQTIRINEAVSSNSIFLDEDGDSPDWFELYNYGSEAVALDQWSITDDLDELSKWTFPEVTLPADEYLLVWASDKDRQFLSYARTLVNQGDTFSYLLPERQPPTNWTNLDFNDTAWAKGASGFGYDDGDDATILPKGTISAYLRINFNISDLNDLHSLLLDIDYDDGFVAYINGQEVARAHVNGFPPAFNAFASSLHEAEIYQGRAPERIIIDQPLTILRPGTNVLSIQVHNASAGSSDLSLIPFLSAVFLSPKSEGISPPSLLNLSDTRLHTNFKISSNSETLVLSDQQGKIIDELLIEGLPANHSIGITNSNGELAFYETPTPGAPNTTQENQGIIDSEVVFSHPGGKVGGSFNLVLSGNLSNEEIRFTSDASLPTEAAPRYTGPINISENTVIRARIFRPDYIPSATSSKTYIFDTSHELPIVTLVSDPYNLFDEDDGIYAFGKTHNEEFPFYGANFWEDWERPIQFSFYEEDGNLGTEFNAGVKIFGGWSRAHEQRSLSIFARSQYGTREIDYPLFPNRPYQKFQALVLRTSGQDWLKTMVKDIALTSLMEGTDLDFQAHRSTVTYLNGEYWGIYNLREKINEHFLASKHQVNADEIDLLEFNGGIIEGDNEAYNALLDYLANTNLKENANFTFVEEQIDIDNYMLYQLTQIYFNNTDWPGNNIKFWKHPGGKWRWILFDTDFSFGTWDVSDYSHDMLSFALAEDGPGWPNPPWSTFLFRKLLENTNFRNKFINRYADELNTRFLPENVIKHIESVYQKVSSEIPAHFNRWTDTPGDAPRHIQTMRRFATNRHGTVKYHIKNQFYLPAIHEVTIVNQDTTQGYVRLNDHLNIKWAEWNGDYFEEVPISLEAIPKAGFEFSHWSGSLASTSSLMEVDLESDIRITPNFIPSTTNLQAIVINEINYNSGSVIDPGDWVELYNPNATSIDLSNWTFTDNKEDNVFTFPEGTTIKANGYLILTKSKIDFSRAFPQIMNFIGDFNFGLSSTEDAVKIFDKKGQQQDEVQYTSSSPWPDCANGNGATLELIAPDLDNTPAKNWDCINSNGSPGQKNTVSTQPDPASFSFYPNPVDDFLFLKGLSEKSEVRIYNLAGQLLVKNTVIDGLFVGDLIAGMYLVSVVTNGDTSFKFKIVKN